MRHTLKQTLLTVFVFLYCSVLPLSAQNIISVKEILNSPEHYFNQIVRIEGKVIEIQQEGENLNGKYILESGDMKIAVSSTILPELKKKYKVTVKVEKGENPQQAVFVEISRTKKDFWKYGSYIFGGVALVLCAALVFGGSGTVSNAN